MHVVQRETFEAAGDEGDVFPDLRCTLELLTDLDLKDLHDRLARGLPWWEIAKAIAPRIRAWNLRNNVGDVPAPGVNGWEMFLYLKEEAKIIEVTKWIVKALCDEHIERRKAFLANAATDPAAPFQA